MIYVAFSLAMMMQALTYALFAAFLLESKLPKWKDFFLRWGLFFVFSFIICSYPGTPIRMIIGQAFSFGLFFVGNTSSVIRRIVVWLISSLLFLCVDMFISVYLLSVDPALVMDSVTPLGNNIWERIAAKSLYVQWGVAIGECQRLLLSLLFILWIHRQKFIFGKKVLLLYGSQLMLHIIIAGMGYIGWLAEYETFSWKPVFVMGSICFLVNILLLFHMIKTNLRLQAEKQLMLMELSIQNNEGYYKCVQEGNEYLGKKRHDFNNQLAIAINLLEQGKAEVKNEAMALINEMKKDLMLEKME